MENNQDIPDSDVEDYAEATGHAANADNEPVEMNCGDTQCRKRKQTTTPPWTFFWGTFMRGHQNKKWSLDTSDHNSSVQKKSESI